MSELRPATLVGTPRRARAGFTLLEVMAALSVFLIGIVSVLALLSAGTRLHQESQNMGITADTAEEALLISQREVAEQAPYTQQAQGGLPDSPPKRPIPSRPDLQYQWRVQSAPEGDLFLLLVDVTWLEAGKERKLTLQRVLPRLQSPAVDARRLWAAQK